MLAWTSQHLAPSEAAKRMSARFFAPIFYGGYEATGQGRITVLTIDDDDLGIRRSLQSWPPPLDYYATLIDTVAAYGPRALFIDVLFLDERPVASIQALVAAACRARAANIRVYIAALSAASKVVKRSTQDLLLEAKNGEQVCIEGVAPNAIEDAYDRTAWEYPLNSGKRSSAALKMFCDEVPAACPAETPDPLAVVWGLDPAPTNVKIFLGHDLVPLCRAKPWSDWLPMSDREGFLPRALTQRELPRCPYHQVVPVRALAGFGFSTEELDHALSGKLLLVGTGFQSHGDTVVSPLHGRLPGVHLHAMALDNLLTYADHGGYRRAGDFEFLRRSPATDYTWLAVGLLAVGMALWSWWVERWRGRVQRHAPPPARRQGPLVPRRSARFASKAWAVVHVLSMGRYPRPPQPMPRSYRWGRFCASIALAFAGVCVLFLVGDRWIRVGPLAMIEYLLFPLGVEFLHWGERIARAVVAAWQALWHRDTADYLRSLPDHSASHEHPGRH